MGTMSIIYSTFPNQEKADHILNNLIEHKLAACGNVWSSSSKYMWDGAIMQEGEYCAYIKTLPDFLDRCIAEIKAMHPYDVPCILHWQANGNEAYIAWMESVLSP